MMLRMDEKDIGEAMRERILLIELATCSRVIPRRYLGSVYQRGARERRGSWARREMDTPSQMLIPRLLHAYLYIYERSFIIMLNN